jgi:hypothetical protein
MSRMMFALVPCLLAASAATANVATLSPSKDNTMFQESEDFSNGAGQFLFCGTTAQGPVRRGLLAFDIAGAIPAGSTITGVSLTLYMDRTVTGAAEVTLHKVTADWGEGLSIGSRGEGFGAPALAPDATWHYRRFSTETWAADGGDFVAAVSATQSVDGLGYYTWSGPGLVADAQAGLDNGAGNFGWLLKGDEVNPATAKRFASRENADPAYRPRLVIEYTAPCRVDLNDDGQVNVADFLAFLQLYAAGDTRADINADSQVNVGDFLAFLAAYAAGC